MDPVDPAVRDLTDAERELLLLAYTGGHSQQQIATLLGPPVGTIKSRTRITLQRLRRTLRTFRP